MRKRDRFYAFMFWLMTLLCGVLVFLMFFILSDKYNEPVIHKLNPKDYDYCFENDNYIKGLEQNNPDMPKERLTELKAQYYIRCINEKGVNNE